MNTSDQIVTAVARSELALCEQLCQWESLAFGVAYWSKDFPRSPVCNQLRDVWLAEVEPQTAFDQAEAYFRERGCLCGTWSSAAGQADEPVAALLCGKGWRQVMLTAWALTNWDWVDGTAPHQIRVLPARAMPKAFRATFDGSDRASAQHADIAVERLNDSRYDVFVATREGEPAGRIGYLQVGDIARLTDLHVVPGARGSGVARAMVAHLLQHARRLLPKCVVACRPADEAEAASFLERCGFSRAAELSRFERPF